MIHLLAMALFAFFVAVVFSVVSKDCLHSRFAYGAKVFFAFLLIGLTLAWLMYPVS